MVLQSSCLAGSLRVQRHRSRRNRLPRRNNTPRNRTTSQLVQQQLLRYSLSLYRQRTLHNQQQRGQDEQSLRPHRTQHGKPSLRTSQLPTTLSFVAGNICFVNPSPGSACCMMRFSARLPVFHAEQPNQSFPISALTGSYNRELGITWDPPPRLRI